MKQFKNFLNQIPADIRNNVETYATKNLILFKPDVYINKTAVNADDYHIVLTTSLSPPTFFGNKLYQIDKGRLITVNPNTAMCCTERRVTSQYYALCIKENYVNKAAQDLGFDKKIIFTKLEQPCSMNLKQAVLGLERELKSFPTGWELLQESMSLQIAILLIREASSNFNIAGAWKSHSSNSINISIEYIQTFFSSNISINDICKEIYITPYHFIRMFKHKTGMTPHEYLMNVRIDHAKKLLKNRECTVTEAAHMCGFVSLPHFSSVFKEKTGMSPSEYKKFYYIKQPTQ